MLEDIKNIKRERSDFRKFGITVGIVLMIIAGLLFWIGKESFQIFLGIGIGLCVLGVATPAALKPIYFVWMIFATIMGWIMTRVILSFLFFLVVTQIGLILRLFGKQFLNLKWDKSQKSYWNIRNDQVKDKKSYELQF